MEILFFLIGLVIVVGLAKLLGKSLSFIKKIIVNSISGFILLWIFNFIASFFGYSLDINFINCLLVGMFGLPAIAILLLISLF